MPFTKLFSAAEVAPLFHTTPYAITRLCRLKKLRASKVNGAWLISAEAVEEYLRATENTQDVA